TIPVLMLSILIVIRHRENIVRLWQGKESKVWDKTKRPKE
ncbi:glycerol-3-phosphate acyltransferase, partial [Enterococcus faecium]